MPPRSGGRAASSLAAGPDSSDGAGLRAVGQGRASRCRFHLSRAPRLWRRYRQQDGPQGRDRSQAHCCASTSESHPSASFAPRESATRWPSTTVMLVPRLSKKTGSSAANIGEECSLGGRKCSQLAAFSSRAWVRGVQMQPFQMQPRQPRACTQERVQIPLSTPQPLPPSPCTFYLVCLVGASALAIHAAQGQPGRERRGWYPLAQLEEELDAVARTGDQVVDGASLHGRRG